ncbi:MAG: toxin-antitoxin system HicB family antitoxin [Pseudonocardia sp.]
MDLSQYVARLREDLAAAAAAGDEQTRRTAGLLAGAIEPAARLTLMNALADLAAEVTEALGDRTVEVRLDGRDVRVSVSGEPEHAERDGHDERADTPPPPPPPPPFRPGGDDISRITLRLVEQIKSQAEQAAAAQGVSLNSWVAQAVQGALQGADQRHRRRDRHEDRNLRGWVQG